jgi:two-component system, OmpR family, response regulator ResD
MNEKILVVDDEESIVEFLQSILSKENFIVITAGTGKEAVYKVKETSPDLVLLDIMLPDNDGFTVCKELRDFTTVPIIMLTARDEDMDKIIGLEMGADDYIVKPFNPKELVARMKSIFRRIDATGSTTKQQKIEINALSIDVFRRKAWVKGELISLAPKEFDLLLMLSANPNKIFTREDLLREIWGDEFIDSRSVDVHIKYVREKVGKQVANCIHTVWGKGYKFVDTP